MSASIIDKVYSILSGIIHPGELKLAMHQKEDKNKYPEKKICPVTGLDISMQPKNSKFISYTGVKWYYANDPDVYFRILAPKLTDYWKDQPMKVQFREIAHNIRDEDSNKRHSTRRKIDKLLEDKSTLFNNYNLIDRQKLKDAGMIGSSG